MKGDTGFPGIGLQGWSGQKVNLHNWFNMIYYLLYMLFTFHFLLKHVSLCGFE